MWEFRVLEGEAFIVQKQLNTSGNAFLTFKL